MFPRNLKGCHSTSVILAISSETYSHSIPPGSFRNTDLSLLSTTSRYHLNHIHHNLKLHTTNLPTRQSRLINLLKTHPQSTLLSVYLEPLSTLIQGLTKAIVLLERSQLFSFLIICCQWRLSQLGTASLYPYFILIAFIYEENPDANIWPQEGWKWGVEKIPQGGTS